MPPKPCKTATANKLKAFFSDDTALCLSTWTSPEDPHFGRDRSRVTRVTRVIRVIRVTRVIRVARVWGLGLARFQGY